LSLASFVTADNVLAAPYLLNLGSEELVEAGGLDIRVPGYSVPSLVDWNSDGRPDLVIGEGSYAYPGKVRVYLNVGSASAPQFADYFYAQSNSSDLVVPSSGCLGCFPRVVYWDADDRKDLLVGLADGTIKIFLNTAADDVPVFDAGATVVTGVADMPTDLAIDVGSRATPAFVDWDHDDRTDLVVGALDGKIHIYLNCGCGGAVPPNFWVWQLSGAFAQENGFDLVVPSSRSSPVVVDLDGDDKNDLLAGNTEGELLFYPNVGTDTQPSFSGFSLIESNGVPINLPGSPRSRPSVCDWTGDGYFDVLIGAGDGKVHLYQSIGQPGDVDKDYDVDFQDFAFLAASWQQTDNGSRNYADLTGDGKVNIDDLRRLAENWLLRAK
jgi:hypothetical protein